MKLVIFIFCALLTTSIQANESTLKERYLAYKSQVETADTLLPLILYHSDKKIASFERYFKHSDIKVGIETLFNRMKFPNIMSKTQSIKETISHNEGCMLVTGFNQGNEKVSFHIKYVFEKSQWKIDNIDLELLEDHQSFFTSPICSDEKRQALRTKEWEKLN